MNLLAEVTRENVVPVENIPQNIQYQLEQMKSIGVNIKTKKDEVRPISTRDRIQNLCGKYNLKMLELRYYNKLIPLENIEEIKKYKEEHKYHDLHIIAPAEHFQTTKYVRPAKGDPLVVDLNHSGEVKSIVTTWGNDFTFFRRLFGLWMFPSIKVARMWGYASAIVISILVGASIANGATLLECMPATIIIQSIVMLVTGLVHFIFIYLDRENEVYDPKRFYNNTDYGTNW